MLTKEQRIKEIKIRIKNNEDMYNRLKDIASKDDKVLVAIQENIRFLKNRLEKLESSLC